MRVRYTLRSRRDLEEMYRYIDRQTPALARVAKGTIERRIQLLSEFPFIAPETDVAGVYGLVIGRYPYTVYYRMERDDVWIVHIRHERRQPWTDNDYDYDR